jgi:L-aspartate semialdehyde sulfurtransferase ferredoxin
MIKKKIILGFPENIVKKPIVYKLVKDFELEFNILRAEITPDIEGKMLIDIKGSKERIEQCLDFLKSEGVIISEASKDLIFYKDLCVNCGLCASVCIGKAFTLNSSSYEIELDKDKCILCGLCQDACPVKAIKLNI